MLINTKDSYLFQISKNIYISIDFLNERMEVNYLGPMGSWVQ